MCDRYKLASKVGAAGYPQGRTRHRQLHLQTTASCSHLGGKPEEFRPALRLQTCTETPTGEANPRPHHRQEDPRTEVVTPASGISLPIRTITVHLAQTNPYRVNPFRSCFDPRDGNRLG